MADMTVFDLMEAYAVWGYQDWNENTSEQVRRRAMTCLNQKIVESDWQVRAQVRKRHDSKKKKFMPVPKYRHDGIDRCFFMPRSVGNDHEPKLAFDLFLLVNQAKNLAFRLEPADQPRRSHNYAHVQFCRRMMGGDFDPVGVPSWIPDSYPAFPLPSSEPVQLFLAMLTAVHGRSGGVERVLQDIFQRQSQPTNAAKCVELLGKMLGR